MDHLIGELAMEPNRPSRPPRYHKPIRLPLSAYTSSGRPCAVTIAVQSRREVFADPRLAEAAIETLRDLAWKTSVGVLAYCIMPDHVHLIISPTDQCDVVSFVGRFKSLTLRLAWKTGLTGTFWQKSFYDHILRSEESATHAIEYILNNPVRRRIVETWSEYPYAGSLLYDL